MRQGEFEHNKMSKKRQNVLVQLLHTASAQNDEIKTGLQEKAKRILNVHLQLIDH